MKKVLLYLLLPTIVAFNIFMANALKNGAYNFLLFSNVEILTDDENIQWDQLRLEIKDCVCNSGIKKTGKTLQCTEEGTLEQCSETQQGSNACYDAHLFPPGINILCEGKDYFTILP